MRKRRSGSPKANSGSRKLVRLIYDNLKINAMKSEAGYAPESGEKDVNK